MRDFLLEIGMEEIPASFAAPACEELQTRLQEMLAANRIGFSSVDTFHTPRRLALRVSDVEERQSDLIEEIKGPPKRIAFKDGMPTKAAEGFARSQQVSLDDVQVREVDGAEYLFAAKHQEGNATASVLPEMLGPVISNLSFPKTMRWGNGSLRSARPIRWILAIFGSDVVSFSVGTVQSGDSTFGHRQLSPGPHRVVNPAEYEDILRQAFVIADAKQRKTMIQDQIRLAAAECGGKVRDDQRLLAEVTNLVEYPTAFVGYFDRSFLEIPQEVLITTMQSHQRYFPVVGETGTLLNAFVGVRNGTDDSLELVAAGNERVLRARLADAKFFWDEDRTIPLADRVESLRSVVFQDGLGTMYDKAERLAELAGQLAPWFDSEDQKSVVERAAWLAKADLVTQMVFEFPELQGVMGGKYARTSGEDASTAAAIGEHYRPRFAGDLAPATLAGAVVSAADKLDTLAGYFALGRVPTGSQDPFALRRQAQGVVQILLERRIYASLTQLVSLALERYSDLLTVDRGTTADRLVSFLKDRLRGLLLNAGCRYDVADAVLAGSSDIAPEIWDKGLTLQSMRFTQPFQDLMTAFERASNLAAKSHGDTVDPGLLAAADQKLWSTLTELETIAQRKLRERDYTEAIVVLAGLKPSVDEFFAAVMVMDSDPAVRANRLAMLQKIVTITKQIADLRQIVMDM